jgi:hypothetical protein
MEDGRWYSVKVFDPESQTYTRLDKFAVSEEDAENQVDPAEWIVVREATREY